jgi:hypothetical protein
MPDEAVVTLCAALGCACGMQVFSGNLKVFSANSLMSVPLDIWRCCQKLLMHRAAQASASCFSLAGVGLVTQRCGFWVSWNL